MSSAKYAAAHATPNGPGDARPTALQIIEDEGLMGKLNGKVMLITGASSGIGVETARALHAAGADVYLPVRNMEKGEGVVQDILGTNASSSGKVTLLKMDLNSLQSVRECAAEFLSKSQQLNVLINNAGIMATPESQTADGFESQFGTNHLAHFLLFQHLKGTLLSSSSPSFNSRVVNLSSTGHRSSPVLLDDLDLKKQGYDPWVAYGQAKTANIWMANEIERRYGDVGLHATSLSPGGIMTGLQVNMDERMKAMFEIPELQKFLKNVEQGAATTVWAAVGAEWEGRGGKYLDDCAVAPKAPPGCSITDSGYETWAYDVEGATKLWEVSLELVGLST